MYNYIILSKITPRRIILEEKEGNGIETGDYYSSPALYGMSNFTRWNLPDSTLDCTIWRVVDE